MRNLAGASMLLALALAWTNSAAADVVLYNNDVPLGLMATASRPDEAAQGKIEIESADDFVVTSPFQINGSTFSGLLVGGTNPAITSVTVEIYRVFPLDSTSPPSGHVPTRANSPSDVELVGRSTVDTNLTFTTTVLSSAFSASNSVLNGINAIPNQTTGGEGAVRGTEVRFNVTFTTPITLDGGHYFFVPQVGLSDPLSDFYWLSAPRPPSITPFAPDLQSWIRNASLDPDWLRVGTDIVGGSPAPTFNAAFSLTGVSVPEPTSMALVVCGGAALLAAAGRRRLRGLRF